MVRVLPYAAIFLAALLAPLAKVPESLSIFSSAGVLIALQQIVLGVAIGMVAQFVFDALGLAGQLGQGAAIERPVLPVLEVGPKAGRGRARIAAGMHVQMAQHLLVADQAGEAFDVGGIVDVVTLPVEAHHQVMADDAGRDAALAMVEAQALEHGEGRREGAEPALIAPAELRADAEEPLLGDGLRLHVLQQPLVAVPAAEPGTAFIDYTGRPIADVLCIQEDRVVGADNCVAWNRRSLQIPPQRHRQHYVRATVRVHEYPDGRLAIFDGPRCLARFNPKGRGPDVLSQAA